MFVKHLYKTFILHLHTLPFSAWVKLIQLSHLHLQPRAVSATNLFYDQVMLHHNTSCPPDTVVLSAAKFVCPLLWLVLLLFPVFSHLSSLVLCTWSSLSPMFLIHIISVWMYDGTVMRFYKASVWNFWSHRYYKSLKITFPFIFFSAHSMY
jgi:hypothetical protein